MHGIIYVRKWTHIKTMSRMQNSSQDRFLSQFSFQEINFPNNWENGVEFG